MTNLRGARECVVADDGDVDSVLVVRFADFVPDRFALGRTSSRVVGQPATGDRIVAGTARGALVRPVQVERDRVPADLASVATKLGRNGVVRPGLERFSALNVRDGRCGRGKHREHGGKGN